ncbi:MULTISPECIES: alanine--tRNA ligase [unclassified Wenzhouxiangella]|uniref:alanine--tRNA ligase n=1 Tax=unclassified Wenzhouxiangella TaxID=2613841 RepID=UPI000E32AD13|nr:MULTISPECIES: alanine--tRNA ligase [unclassified Wenzhouxiangella]RFF26303.1 alanine--tRNA ligase [Wenzhouxiangella sp. 15181]RFP67426.1 alanine--tRNA ligase [Wenzhouxiangella sp. 15190]
MKTTAEIRQTFLDFFAERDHRIVPSSSLVPANDPTLLFTNAGMVQFKDVFLGSEKRSYSRATTSQRCVRAGGKHNDLENVGYTARHHTFFEMLGNFSFGDYFKREAIEFAWEFLTNTCGFPPEKLWVTVYEEDDEAADIWLKEIGVDPERFSRIGAEDNFWAMGDTGPCGPCSEIFYDHGPEVPGGPPGTPEEDGDRYIEVWNLVFMQYDRASDGTLSPLPAPSVDTGMGLERLAAILQGVHSNYDIDLFRHLIDAAAELTGARDRDSASLKVIADHIRACAFLIVDGVLPSNEGRGYVLRRIIRRAIRHGYKLGCEELFFSRMVAPLSDVMGDAYPELVDKQEFATEVLEREEKRFGETLDQGMKLLEDAIAELDGSEIPGEVAFKLYDTFGFPVDLTRDIARERELTVDEEGFEQAMQQQRERARAAGKFAGGDGMPTELIAELPATRFLGHEQHSVDDAEVLAILVDGKPVDAIDSGDEAVLVLDRTPFYAESGGQVGDTGRLDAKGAHFEVTDTRKFAGAFHGHVGRLAEGSLKVGQRLSGQIDSQRRADIVRHHSATHLLHSALRTVLGEHVQQKGSLVAPDRLRFDFSHHAPVTEEELAEIERLVNEQVQANAKAETRHMPFDEAIEAGALAFFDEKYGDEVRVLRFGDFSMELCGGTHVDRMGDIGLFKIISETGISAGVRRIEAVAGRVAVDWLQKLDHSVREASGQLKTSPEQLSERVGQLLGRSRELEKELERLKGKLASAVGSDLASQAVEIDGVQLIATKLEGADPNSLRDTVDQLKNKIGSGVIVLGTPAGNGVRLVAGVTKDLTDRIKAGELVNHVAGQVGGKGGGRPDFAQAGGSDVSALPSALESVADWLRDRL